MWQIVEKIKQLKAAGAVHRRGFHINEITPTLVCGHGIGEFAEALAVIVTDNNKEKLTEELADTLNCLVHTAVLSDIDPSDIVTAALHKLELRFKVPAHA